MANKRNRTRRNKKANNWKAILKSREQKEKIEIAAAPGCSKTHVDIVDENSNNSIKRRRISNSPGPEERNILHESQNYFQCLDEEDDDHVSINPNHITNNHETQPEIDPLSSADDENVDIPDEGEDVDDEYIDEAYFDENDNDKNVADEDRDDSIMNEDECESDDRSSSAEEQVTLEEKLNGRRIFDVSELFQQIKRIGSHSKDCSFENMVVVSEIKRGLNSVFKFQCENCGVLRKIESCPKNPNSLNCNEDAVLGITSVGSGFYHLKEIFTNLNVPVMGPTLYDKIQKSQQSDWWNAASQSALDALFEEIELAKSLGSVDSEGNALIIVICDGSWGKRSYGKGFNSLSGCAVLIGLRTKKVVYFGVRNKYCHTCKIAQSKFTPPNEHTCNKNYSGPSSGMESDIITEGFKLCEEYGARFHKLIADGDSNTYKNIRDSRIYKNPEIFVEKIECVNHLHRNFRSKFANLNKVTKFDCDLRKHVKPSKGRDISKGIKVASRHWAESNLTMSEKISNLEDDIMNAPSHYFGVHDKCKSYFCNKSTNKSSIDNMKLLKDDGIYYEVLNLCQQYFAGNAKSLLLNYTNNPAEEFNNIVTKFIGGKRINYSLGGSYSARVAAAVVQYNSEGHASSEFRKFKFGNLGNSSIEMLEQSRKRKVNANEAARILKPRIRRVAQENNSKAAYYHGDGCEGLDMELDKFEKTKKVLLDKLKYNQQNRLSVEKETRDGKHSSRWQLIRQDLLPSPFFARIIKAQRKGYTKILEELMYKRSEFGNNAAIKHQRLVERDALQFFKTLFNEHSLRRCGIFIDTDLSFLCTSPLKLYGKDHLLNVKCPIKEYQQKFDHVIHKINFWKKEAGHFCINKKSDWFIELQSELHITGRKYGFIMVWLGEWNGVPQYRIVEVPKDDSFFEKEVLPKLAFLWNEAMLKELVNSRKGRHMKLREYDAEQKTFI